jgi:hypothetical protein
MAATKQFIEGKWRYVHEDGTLGMPCSPPTEAERVEYEKRRQEVPASADPVERTFFTASLADHQASVPGAKQYKVLTQRDEWFRGKFDPERLEEAINYYARQGWEIVGVATTDVGSFWGSFMPKGGGAVRQEIVVFMEKNAA